MKTIIQNIFFSAINKTTKNQFLQSQKTFIGRIKIGELLKILIILKVQLWPQIWHAILFSWFVLGCLQTDKNRQNAIVFLFLRQLQTTLTHFSRPFITYCHDWVSCEGAIFSAMLGASHLNHPSPCCDFSPHYYPTTTPRLNILSVKNSLV